MTWQAALVLLIIVMVLGSFYLAITDITEEEKRKNHELEVARKWQLKKSEAAASEK